MDSVESYLEETPVRALPLNSASAETEKLFAKQRLKLETRACFVKACMARGGVYGDRRKIDPVLASHLGIQQK